MGLLLIHWRLGLLGRLCEFQVLLRQSAGRAANHLHVVHEAASIDATVLANQVSLQHGISEAAHSRGVCRLVTYFSVNALDFAGSTRHAAIGEETEANVFGAGKETIVPVSRRSRFVGCTLVDGLLHFGCETFAFASFFLLLLLFHVLWLGTSRETCSSLGKMKQLQPLGYGQKTQMEESVESADKA